jgi:putative DNA primase/helicase
MRVRDMSEPMYRARWTGAVHHTTGGTGLAIWEDWSQKPGKSNAEETEAALPRIDHAIVGYKAPRTAEGGTIIFCAKAAGRKKLEPDAAYVPPLDKTDSGYWGGLDEAATAAIKPTIQVKAGHLDRLATEGEDALCNSNLPIFQRGHAMVRPISGEVPASHGRTTVAAGLSEIGVPGMLDTLSQAAEWQTWNGRQKKLVQCDPPSKVAAVLLSRAGQWRVPHIAGVVTTPTLRPDGTVLSTPGYDSATRLYFVADPSLRIPPLSERPSRTNAEDALALLQSLLDNFPFVSSVDRSVALSAMITVVVRGAMSVAPMHAFKASTAGTGKSFAADLVSAVGTGRLCPVIAAGNTIDETEKRLVGLLLAGYPLVSIDNINGEIGGDLLCQAIERPLIRVRPLGRSEIVEIESRATILCTGNNLRVSGDATRRTLCCNLDAGMERPELRKFDFDPVQQVFADRGRYVAAAIAIVRAYLAANSPGRLTPIASFADWSDTVRSALVWLGCADPCDSMEAARDDDPELGELREVLGAWQDNLSVGERYTVRAIADAAESRIMDDTAADFTNAFRLPDLRDALLRIAGERGCINTKRLGKWFLKYEGRIVGKLRLTRDTMQASGGVVQWIVKSV